MQRKAERRACTFKKTRFFRNSRFLELEFGWENIQTKKRFSFIGRQFQVVYLHEGYGDEVLSNW
jgi:hypothetical protein